MIAKLEWTQSNAIQNLEQLQNPTMGVTINKESTTTESPPQNRQQPKPLGGLYAFYLYQIFALDSTVVEAQNVKLTWRLPIYCNVSSWRNNTIKLTHYDETKKMAHGSLIVRAKVNLKLNHGGPSYRQTLLVNSNLLNLGAPDLHQKVDKGPDQQIELLPN